MAVVETVTVNPSSIDRERTETRLVEKQEIVGEPIIVR
jgi:hypothetical protein